MKVKVFCLLSLMLVFGLGSVQAATYTDSNCDWCNLQWPYSFTVDAVSPTIYGQIYVAGITDVHGDPLLILAEVGFGPYLSNPLLDDTDWSWVTASYNDMFLGSNNFEYMGTISFTDPGTFSYTFRYSRDGGFTWTLTDYGMGTVDGIDVNQFGVATVLAGTGSPVPLPGAIWMFSAGLLGIAGFGRKTKVY